jgi:hypothetical protein
MRVADIFDTTVLGIVTLISAKIYLITINLLHKHEIVGRRGLL